VAQPPRDVVVRAHGEVRGTQSFVQVMASVFRRPSLVAMEIAWRWVLGLVVLGVVATTNREAFAQLFNAAYWRGLGEALLHGAFTFAPGVGGSLLLVAGVVMWAAVSGLARGVIMRRLDAGPHARRATVVVLTVLRVLAFSVFVAGWVWALAWIGLSLVRSSDPNYVLGFAGAVVWTLLLFMFWSVVSWVFPLAIMLAMARDFGVGASLRTAWGMRALRSKLIEINLVMGIVKVCLVVLAMVFSATPLPFESFATQGFLVNWWVGVAVFYVVASDFFHVVRVASGLALYRALTEADFSSPRADESAS
jgi:hypothetical protein